MGGLLDIEAEATMKRLDRHLATKLRQPYFRTCGHVWIRVSITIFRYTYRFIQGYRLPEIWISVQRPQWGYGAGINLFR